MKWPILETIGGMNLRRYQHQDTAQGEAGRNAVALQHRRLGRTLPLFDCQAERTMSRRARMHAKIAPRTREDQKGARCAPAATAAGSVVVVDLLAPS